MHVDRLGPMNYYEILEVSPNASKEVLKAAYKSLMQRYHPDRNPDNAAAAAHSVLMVQAYEVLSDANKRAAYDMELKRQLESLNNIRGRTRDVLASAALADTERKSHWFLWLLIVLSVLFFWYLLSPAAKQKSAAPGLKETGSLLGGRQSKILQNDAGAGPAAAVTRTIPIFLKDISVNLEDPAGSTPSALDDARQVLSIQTLGVVVGTFDPDKFISFLEKNKEFIGRKLAEKLVSAKYEVLIRHDGDRYLKQFILDALGEITDTNRFEGYPSPGTETPAHYGVVDILLPDSFTVKPQQSGKVAVP
jgi:curved DNA-binding protein CbpA